MSTTVILEELLTTKALERAFSVSFMTIYNWRKLRELPFVEVPGDSKNSIYFEKPKVKAWARKNKVAIKEAF